MSNVLKLAHALKKLDDKIVKCMRCGTCQSVCPVFAESLAEGDVTRGKLALLANLSQKILTDAQGVRNRLERCLLCGSCQSACPSGVSILEIFMEARALCTEYLGLNPIKKIIFQQLLCRPKLFSFLMLFTPLSKLVMSSDKNAQNTVCSPLIKLAMGERHIPAMPSKTFTQKYRAISIKAKDSKPTVLFFPGCMGDKVYVSTTEACLKIFKHHGVGVEIPTNMSCCGIPALASGDVKSFKTMLKQNVEILKNKNFDYIVTACASCTETIKDFWREHSAEMDCKNDVAKISEKAIDINDFLVNILKVDLTPHTQSSKKTKITYHDSCHLKKSLGIWKEPRALLNANGNYELVEMKDADRCCGCGGSFTLTHYDLSKKIGNKKQQNIQNSNAEVVAMGCPACMMQVSNSLALAGNSISVKHVAEIYAETLPNN